MQDIPVPDDSDPVARAAARGPGNSRKRWLAIAGGGLFMLIAAALILPGFIDWSGYRAPLSSIAQDLLGQEVRLEGDIRLRLLPSPAFQAGDVVIGPREGGAPPLARIGRFDVAIDVFSLLEGEIAVKRLSLVEPDIHLEAGSEPFGSAGEEASGEKSKGGLAIERLSVRRGRLLYQDRAAGVGHEIADLDGDFSIGGMSGPFRAEGSASLAGHRLAFDLDSKAFISGERVPLSLAIEIAGGRIALAGWLRDGDLREVGGRLRLSGSDLPGLLTALAAITGRAAPALPDLPARDFSLSAEMLASMEGGSLTDIEGALLGTRIGGSMAAALAPEPRIDADLRFDRVAIDGWLAAGQSSPESPKSEPTGELLAALAPLLRSDLALSIRMAADAIGYRDMLATSATLELARAAGGPLRINRLEASLPGAGKATFDGTVGESDGVVDLQSRLTLSAGNARALLASLGMTTDYPPGMLTQFRLEGDLALAGTTVSLSGANLVLDGMTGTGSLRLESRDDGRDAASLMLMLDRLDLDAWIPAPDQEVTETWPAMLRRFAAGLPDIDLSGDLGSGALRFGGRDYRDTALGFAIAAGRLKIGHLRLGDARGSMLSANGDITLAEPHDFRISARLALPEPAATLAAFAISPPLDVTPFGAAEIAGDVSGTPEKVDLGLVLETAHGTASLGGGLSFTGDGGINDLALRGRASLDSQCRLADWFRCDAGARLSKPVALDFDLAGNTGKLAVSASLAALDGGKLDISGTLVEAGSDKEAIDLETRLSHPSFARLMAVLGSDPAPQTSTSGPMALDAHISGNRRSAEVAIRSARLDATEAKGRVALALAGERPRFEADITADQPPYRRQPAAMTRRGEAPANAPPKAWSQQPVDFGPLRAVDGVLRLRAGHLGGDAFQFEALDAELQLEGGILSISRAEARLFDGAIGLEGALDVRDMPKGALRVQLADADLEQMLMAFGGIAALRGRASGKADLATFGESEYDLVRNLSGTADLASQSGAISGIDLGALVAGLETLRSPTEVPVLLATALGGGETAFRDFGGTIRIERGVMRSDDLGAALQVGTASGSGSIDLPDSTIAMKGLFMLDAAGKAPPLGVDVRGNLAAPKIVFDENALLRWAMGRIGSRVIERLSPSRDGFGLPDIFGGRRSGKDEEKPQPEPPSRP